MHLSQLSVHGSWIDMVDLAAVANYGSSNILSIDYRLSLSLRLSLGGLQSQTSDLVH